MWRGTPLPHHGRWSEDSLWKLLFFSHHMASRDNSGYQAGQQVSLPAEPSCQFPLQPNILKNRLQIHSGPLMSCFVWLHFLLVWFFYAHSKCGRRGRQQRGRADQRVACGTCSVRRTVTSLWPVLASHQYCAPHLFCSFRSGQ